MKTKASLAMVVMLGACSLAPHYHTPDTLPVTSYKESGDWIALRGAADQPISGPWWKNYHDDQLNALEDKLTGANQDLKAALARYEQAVAIAHQARADFFPTVTANAGATRNHASTKVANPTPVSTFNNYVLEGDVSYEVDLWGRVRNAVNASESQAKASDADRAAVELSLRAQLATDYFALRADDAAITILDDTTVAYEKALTLTQNRFNGGAASEIDVDQAQTQYANAKTQSADIRLKRAQMEHAIAVLIGLPPAAFTMPANPLMMDMATPLPRPELPSTLLTRRPDIVASEQRVVAANAQIGVARAAWFPVFSLTGAAGFESASSSSWISTPARFWSIGPQALLTVFDAGRINGMNDQARAVYDEAAANYRQNVLTAYLEVEDNLAALRQLSQESASQNDATTSAERALQRSMDRYNGGLITYLDVVTEQNTALQAKLASMDILNRRMAASVLLIKALGGGWDGAKSISDYETQSGFTEPVVVSH